MTGTASRPGRRFAIVPAIAAVVGIAILIGLGVWQIQRLHWKEGLLAAYRRAAGGAAAAARTAARAGGVAALDVDYHRVEATCPDLETTPFLRLYAVWRGLRRLSDHRRLPPRGRTLPRRSWSTAASSPRGCRSVAAGRWRLPSSASCARAIRATSSRRRTSPVRTSGTGATSRPWPRRWASSAPAPSFLMLERPAPPPGGPTPAAVPADIPNNHLQYAITWFGLALALAGVYLASLWQGGAADALHLDPRRGAADRLPRRGAGGPRARRRPLRARGLAAADARRDRRLRRASLRRGVRRQFWRASPAMRSAHADLLEMANEAYAGFTHAAVAPLRQLTPGLWLLELFHGPTLAFKDIAMQLLARLYEHALAAKGQTLTIVCATSGDTGGAAVEALSRPSRRAAGRRSFPRARSARCSGAS